MRTTYYCDICGAAFDHFDECLKHERDDHVKPKSYAEIESFFVKRSENCYPDWVYLTMADGAVVAYNFTSVVHDREDADPTEKKETFPKEEGKN